MRDDAPASAQHEHEAHTVGAQILAWRSTPAAGAGAGHDASSRPRQAASASSGRPPATGPPPARRLRIASTPSPLTSGSGRALSIAERNRFEEPLGLDLSEVRIHDGPPAEQAAAQRRAHAFAYGSHIVLGRTVQRAGEGRLLAVLAHELIHVGQQSPAVAANDARYAHAARAPPHDPQRPTITPAPLGVMCLAEDDDSLIPGWASAAASAVAEAGAGAFEAVAGTAAGVGSLVLESAAVVVDRLAPGLLAFLRGGALGQLADLFCRGVDTLLGGLFAGLGQLDFMSALETSFSALAHGVRAVQASIGNAASAAIGTALEPLVQVLAAFGTPLIETLQGVATRVNALFGSVWDGLAVPALDFLQGIGGEIWKGFNDLVGFVWDLAAPIRTGAEFAWNWLLDTFDLAWSSTSGVRDWLAGMAGRAWDAFRETIEPARTPLMAAGGVALALSPLGPIVLLTQVLPPVWERITWLWNNWNSDDILVRAQDVLRDDVLPAVLGTASAAAAAIGGAATWLAQQMGTFGAAMSDVLGAVGANRCLAAVMTYLNGVADQFARLSAWAETGFAGLAGALTAVFDALVAIFQPIMDFLVRLTMVVANPPLLPLAIGAAIWLLCPNELKPPVIDFVVDLLIAFVDGSTVFLTGLGPMAFVLQAGALGFLRTLRSGGGIDDARRIDASNKIANLAAGGGPAFVVGYALGFLHGVIDGIIDPFRLIFLIGRVLVTGAQAIGRALAPFLRASLLGEAALSPAFAGTTTGSAEPAAPAPLPGEPSDAQVAAALGPGTAAEVEAAAAGPVVDEALLGAEMRTELQTEGATVGGLAQLLGDAWNAILQGADRLGRSAASALIEFILLPDFQLGRKLGFVTGFVALQALIIYLTAGGYAVLEATAPLWRQLLALFLRFLDLGGEILGLLGRALRPLRGPLLRGLGAVRGMLNRFRFARGLLERIESLAAVLFRFGDDAAGVGARRGVEPAGRIVGEGTEAAGARTTREGLEESAERASREAVETLGERARIEAADDLGPGALRTAEDPRLPTLRDEALKATELPRALAEAKAIEAVQDAIPHNPVSVALAALTVLKRRYRWIDRFTAIPLAPGLYQIELVASPGIPVGRFSSDDLPPEIEARLQAMLDEARRLGFEPDEAQLRILARRDPDLLADTIRNIESQFPEQARKRVAQREAQAGTEVRTHVADEVLPVQEQLHHAGAIGDPHSLARTPGGPQRVSTEAGNLVHGRRNAEALREQLGGATVPSQFAADVAAGDIITLDRLPDQLLAELPLGIGSRADRVTRLLGEAEGIIYELKPNTTSGILDGFDQLIRYVDLANAQSLGGRTDWRGVIVVYDAARARAFIPR